MEQEVFAKVVMIHQKDLDNLKKSYRTRNISSKGSLQDQYTGSILTMTGKKKFYSTHDTDFYKFFIK